MPSFKLRYAKYDSKGCLLWGYRRHLQHHDLAYLTVLEGITVSRSRYRFQRFGGGVTEFMQKKSLLDICK